LTVVVVGGGQAGLAVSRELGGLGVEHVVLEGGRVAQSWRDRWDSFTLVTPNWTLDLPGSPYAGDDPEGHVLRDDIVAYLQDYAATHAAAPVQEGVAVSLVEPGRQGRPLVHTSAGPLDADAVVVCTGAYRKPHRPDAVRDLPAGVDVLDVAEYRRPAQLPGGAVLVVGSGQSGVQLAEELALAGRDVVLACGRAPWAPRRFDGTDVVTWLHRVRFFDQPVGALPSPRARLLANVQATGADGGHDLHYRVLQAMGVRLVGRLTGVDGRSALFADDLADSVAFGDARYADMCALVRARLGAEAPAMPEPEPFVADGVTEIDLSGFGAVLLTTGFRPDHASWVRFPVYDELGFPVVDTDLSTSVPGLFFCGVHFLRNRRSALMFGVGDDARLVARTLAEQSV
jgi:putative flavoprotein involved in K+ transport